MSTTVAASDPAQPTPDVTRSEPLPDGPEPLPDDEVFHLLQCRRRRDAVRYLVEHDGGPVRMRDLAEQVAAWEHDTTVAALASKQRQRVYIPLYQTHLPKLDDADVIEYDQHRGRVAAGPRTGSLVPYLGLDVDAERDGVAEDAGVAGDAGTQPATADRPWGRYFAGASLVALAALATTTLLGPDASGTAGPAIAVATFLAFGALTLARLRDRAGGDRPESQPGRSPEGARPDR